MFVKLMIRNQSKAIFNWLPPRLWMGLIFTFSGQSGLPHPAEPGTLADFLLWKTVHLLAYAILAGLLWWALQADRGQALKVRAFGGSWTSCFLFGAFNEYYQRSIPGREGTWVDVNQPRIARINTKKLKISENSCNLS